MDSSSKHGPHADPASAVDLDPGLLAEELEGDGVQLDETRDDVDTPTAPDPADVARRSELAMHLLPSRFPAATVELIEELTNAGAPADLVEAVTALPDQQFDTVGEVWLALEGRPVEPVTPIQAADADGENARAGEPGRAALVTSAPERMAEVPAARSQSEVAAGEAASAASPWAMADADPAPRTGERVTAAASRRPSGPSGPARFLPQLFVLPVRLTAGGFRLAATVLDRLADSVAGPPSS